MSDQPPTKWRYAAVKIDNWWQVVAINKRTGWMAPIAYFVNETLADSYADMSNDIEDPEFYSTTESVPDVAENVPEESRSNIVPFRFMYHLTDWSASDDEELARLWTAMQPKEEIAKALGRTRQAIERRARRLGLISRSKITDQHERDLEREHNAR